MIHKEARIKVDLIVSIPKDVDVKNLIIDIPYDYIKVLIRGRDHNSKEACVVEYKIAERDYLTGECSGCSKEIEPDKTRSNEHSDFFCQTCWEKNRPHESEG